MGYFLNHLPPSLAVARCRSTGEGVTAAQRRAARVAAHVKVCISALRQRQLLEPGLRSEKILKITLSVICPVMPRAAAAEVV